MSSIGFNFAHINAQQERLREKQNQKKEKAMQESEKVKDGVKRGGNTKVHPGVMPSTNIVKCCMIVSW
ncbi:hypothetical protein CTI12_AA148410 [Artemisia annua]|uniref:Uncharacterized protein n=1 Tax=Artemisia annua TaxID=35608 RepID=A0A2U1PIS3_ARTAN|nr:hypothetical protein CTI12_AA148410 [Artemisia annua]